MKNCKPLLGVLVLLCAISFSAKADDLALDRAEQNLLDNGHGPEVFTVHFDKPIHKAQRQRLENSGYRILEASSGNGFIVSGPGKQGLAIAGATMEPLHLRDKVSVELRGVLQKSTILRQPVFIKAVSFLHRSITGIAQAAAETVASKDAPLMVQDASGRGMLWIRVQPRDVEKLVLQLAKEPDILWIEISHPMEFKNDNSSWLIQSADETLGRTIWKHGLNGYGQIVGIADSGLDADACQFRLGADRSEVTLATEQYQPPEFTVTNPDNKVLTYYVIGSADAYDDGSGGFHGTHTVGDVAGDNYEHAATATAAGHDPQDGMAPGARIVFQDIGAENGSLIGLMGVSMYDLLLQSYKTGARIHNNSYGSSMISVAYDSDSASIDQAMWELNDMLVVFAAGNSGSDDQGNLVQKSLGGTGSTAKNTLVAGASGPVEFDIYGSIYNLQDDLLFFSSQGPTADSRLKPDIVAPGMVFSATSDASTAINKGCCDISNNDKVLSNNDDDNCTVDEGWPTFGTSFSSPIAVGAATLVRQYFTDGFLKTGKSDDSEGFTPSNALLKAVIIAGARPLTGEIVGMGSSFELLQPPSFEQGWGRIMLEDSLWFEGDLRRTLVLDDVPNPSPSNPLLAAEPPPYPLAKEAMATGDEHSWYLPVPLPDAVMKVALVWTDPAAAPGASLALVNDLDLELIPPAGDHYLGNKEYDGFGFSQPSWKDQRDKLNNLEVVTIKAPESGWWQVKVSASSVPGNGQDGSDAQGYALAATGQFQAPKVLTIEPYSAAPGDQLQQVHITGEGFVPGMSINMGQGMTIEGLEVKDQNNATIAKLSIDQDANIGPRDALSKVMNNLSSRAEAIFEVKNETAGCGCAYGGSTGLAWILAVLFILTLGTFYKRS